MSIEVRETELPGVLVIEPVVHADERGYFLESWRAEAYAALGIAEGFVQDNLSRSRRGVLRGLHYQEPQAQAKLVQAVRGRVFDVAVDIRRGSPRFGRWTGVELSDRDHRQLWVPEGFAHGFLTLSEEADVAYKCTAPYAAGCEHTIRWDDPALAIDWPLEPGAAPKLSPKDAAGCQLADAVLPAYTGAP